MKGIAFILVNLVTYAYTENGSDTSIDGQSNFFHDYPTYNEIKAYMEALANKHPNKISILKIGKSFEGRDIMGMKISSEGVNKSSIVIDAGSNARDWITVTSALYLSNALVKESNSDIFKNVNMYVFPLINPDGYEYSRKSPANRLWKKTRSTQLNSDCVGVDINQNFDVQWNLVGPSEERCSDNYPGVWAYSESEAWALSKFMSRLNNIQAYLSLHSYGNCLLYPYGYQLRRPQNYHELTCVAEEVKKAIFNVRQTEYQHGSVVDLLYPATGSSSDWAIENAGAKLSYIMQLSNDKFRFEPPTDEISPTGEEVLSVVKKLSDYADGRVCRNV